MILHNIDQYIEFPMQIHKKSLPCSNCLENRKKSTNIYDHILKKESGITNKTDDHK